MSKPKPRRSSRFAPSVPSGTASPGAAPAPANLSPGPKAAPLQPAARRGWAALRFPAAVLLAVLGIVLATYWPAFSAQSQYLDDEFYLHPPALQQPGWASVQRIFGEVLAPSVVSGYYHPLTLVSVMLDFLDPTATHSLLPFHRTTLLLHLLNVALVVVLLYLLFDNWLTAGFLGLLYGLHPLNVDSMLWIAERKTVLSTFFALASLVFYVLYARKRGGDWKHYGAALLLYACALLSKPTALPLAVLLPILDYWPLNRLNRRTLLEKVPFLILAGLLAVVTVVSQQGTGGTGSPPAEYLFGTLPLVICYALALYLSKLVWPAALVADYPFPQPFTLANPVVLVSVIGTLAVVAALAFSARRTRAWLAGGLFFFIAILPALGVIRFTPSIAANRFMYLPMVGLLLPLNWGLNRLWNTTVGALPVARVRMMMAGVGVILVAALIGVTWVYESHWQDTPTLIQYYLTQTPDDWKLYNKLGRDAFQQGDYASAVAEFTQVVRLVPGEITGRFNLGRSLYQVGKMEAAKQEFQAAIQIAPDAWPAHLQLGLTLMKSNDVDGALQSFRAAAQFAPMDAEAHYNIAQALARQGKQAEAAQEYRQTLQLNPNYTEAQSALDAMPKQP